MSVWLAAKAITVTAWTEKTKSHPTTSTLWQDRTFEMTAYAELGPVRLKNKVGLHVAHEVEPRLRLED